MVLLFAKMIFISLRVKPRPSGRGGRARDAKHLYAAVAYRSYLKQTLPFQILLPLRALLRWPCDQSPLGNVNNRLLLLRVATKTFDPLPLVCMIKALQSSELRKHSLVRLNDLLLT